MVMFHCCKYAEGGSGSKALTLLVPAPLDSLAPFRERILDRGKLYTLDHRRVVGLDEREREPAGQLAANRPQQVALVEDPVPAPEHMLVVAEWPPGEAHPGGDVVEVRVDEAAGHAHVPG